MPPSPTQPIRVNARVYTFRSVNNNHVYKNNINICHVTYSAHCIGTGVKWRMHSFFYRNCLYNHALEIEFLFGSLKRMTRRQQQTFNALANDDVMYGVRERTGNGSRYRCSLSSHPDYSHFVLRAYIPQIYWPNSRLRNLWLLSNSRNSNWISTRWGLLQFRFSRLVAERKILRCHGMNRVPRQFHMGRPAIINKWMATIARFWCLIDPFEQ